MIIPLEAASWKLAGACSGQARGFVEFPKKSDLGYVGATHPGSWEKDLIHADLGAARTSTHPYRLFATLPEACEPCMSARPPVPAAMRATTATATHGQRLLNFRPHRGQCAASATTGFPHLVQFLVRIELPLSRWPVPDIRTAIIRQLQWMRQKGAYRRSVFPQPRAANF
jgi:hypothetical protein